MNNQLQAQPNSTLSDLVKDPRYSDRFREVLKDRSSQFVSSLIQVGNSLGADCEPRSIIGAAMTAAALDLPIDRNLGLAWIVAYKGREGKVAQFQLGAKGYLQLALRTGQYSRLNVCEIYDGELEDYNRLTGDLKFNPKLRKSDTIVGYASYLRLTTGFEHSEYWTKEEVEQHAKRYSKAYQSGYETPWKTHFDEMAMKTVLSMHVRKWGPMSVQVAKAHSADNSVILDIDSEPKYVDNELEPAKQISKPEIARKPRTQKETAPPIEAKAEPAQEAEPEKEPENIPVSNRDSLIAFAENNGISFAAFHKWFSNKYGNTTDTAQWTDWDSVPEEAASVVVLNQKTMSNMKLICAA